MIIQRQLILEDLTESFCGQRNISFPSPYILGSTPSSRSVQFSCKCVPCQPL
uniref:Uncharacterized protein n=1 Tax=Anguilla anguilla TaxID=7936 RepID=A0A0E9SCV1_ANGAN